MGWMPPPGWELLGDEKPTPAAPTTGWKPPEGFELVEPELKQAFAEETDPLAKSVIKQAFPGARAGPDLSEFMSGVRAQAKALNMSPEHLLTGLLYESPEIEQGNFWQTGPRTKWGTHRGLIQWGEPQAQQYGVGPDMPVGEQLAAATKYLLDRGFEPGGSLLDFYSTINAGKPGLYWASDRPGENVASHVERMLKERYPTAQRLLEEYPEAPSLPAGMLNPGTIDYAKLPRWPEGKGFKTMQSTSFNIDGVEVLLPTIDPATGRKLENDEVLARYRETGQHLGIFDNPDDATAYSKQISAEQDQHQAWEPPAGWETVEEIDETQDPAEASMSFGGRMSDAFQQGVSLTGQALNNTRLIVSKADNRTLAEAIAAQNETGYFASPSLQAMHERVAKVAEPTQGAWGRGEYLESLKGLGDTAWALGAEFVDDPTLMLEFGAQSFGTSLTPMGGMAAGGLAGGPIGMMAGGFAGSMVLEYGLWLQSAVSREVEKAGLDPKSAQDVQEVLNRPGMRDMLQQEAAAKGLTHAAIGLVFDRLTHGLMRMAPAGKLGKVVQGGTSYGMQTISEGVEEGGAQVAATGDFDVADVAQEMLGAGGASALQTGMISSVEAGTRAAARAGKKAYQRNKLKGRIANLPGGVEERLTPEALQDRVDDFIPPPGWEVVRDDDGAGPPGGGPAPTPPAPTGITGDATATPDLMAVEEKGKTARELQARMARADPLQARIRQAEQPLVQARVDRLEPPDEEQASRPDPAQWRKPEGFEFDVSRETSLYRADFKGKMPRFGDGPSLLRVVSEGLDFVNVEQVGTDKRARVPRDLWTEATAEFRAQQAKSLKALLEKPGVTAEEIYSHPAVAAEAREQELRPPTDAKDSYLSPEWRAFRPLRKGKQTLKGYRAGLEQFDKEARQFSPEIAKEKKAVIVIGAPGAGKSTVVEKMLAKTRKAAVLDPDLIKEWIPEFDGGKGSNAVHEESVFLFSKLTDRFLARGENVIMPRSGYSAQGVRRVISRLRKAGYSVDLVNVDVNADNAAKRQMGRWLEKGRFITPSFGRGGSERAKRAYEEVRDAKEADRYANIDANEPFKYRLTEDGDAVQDLEGLGSGRGEGDGGGRVGARGAAKAPVETGALRSALERGTPKELPFKAWFVGSQVVDQNGQPLKVYHHAYEPVNADDAFGLRFNTSPSQSGDAHKFFRALKAGRGYDAEGKPIAREEAEAFVGGKQPKAPRIDQAMAEENIAGRKVVPAYLSIQNPKRYAATNRQPGGKVARGIPALTRKEVDALVAQGYDGAIAYNDDGTVEEAVVFRPEQIRSAIAGKTFEAETRLEELKAEWAKINNELLPLLDDADSAAARQKVLRLKRIVREMHELRGDPTGVRDVVIVGAGPGGMSAAIMGAAEGLDTLMIGNPGGQAKASSRLENYPGFEIGVTGQKLTTTMFEQAKRLGVAHEAGPRVVGLKHDPKTGLKTVKLSDGRSIKARSVVLAGGITPRKLPGIEGEGVVYGDGEKLANLCDGTAGCVIGGSNGAAQAALGAAQKARRITVLSRSPISKSMSDYQVQALRNHPKITVIEGDEIAEIERDKEGRPRAVKTKKGKSVPARAVGIWAGGAPDTSWLPKELRPKKGGVEVNAKLETAIPGVYAVGDFKAGQGGRVGIAVGDGQRAVQNVFGYLFPGAPTPAKPKATAQRAAPLPKAQDFAKGAPGPKPLFAGVKAVGDWEQSKTTSGDKLWKKGKWRIQEMGSSYLLWDSVGGGQAVIFKTLLAAKDQAESIDKGEPQPKAVHLLEPGFKPTGSTVKAGPAKGWQIGHNPAGLEMWQKGEAWVIKHDKNYYYGAGEGDYESFFTDDGTDLYFKAALEAAEKTAKLKEPKAKVQTPLEAEIYAIAQKVIKDATGDVFKPISDGDHSGKPHKQPSEFEAWAGSLAHPPSTQDAIDAGFGYIKAMHVDALAEAMQKYAEGPKPLGSTTKDVGYGKPTWDGTYPTAFWRQDWANAMAAKHGLDKDQTQALYNFAGLPWGPYEAGKDKDFWELNHDGRKKWIEGQLPASITPSKGRFDIADSFASALETSMPPASAKAAWSDATTQFPGNNYVMTATAGGHTLQVVQPSTDDEYKAGYYKNGAIKDSHYNYIGWFSSPAKAMEAAENIASQFPVEGSAGSVTLDAGALEAAYQETMIPKADITAAVAAHYNEGSDPVETLKQKGWALAEDGSAEAIYALVGGKPDPEIDESALRDQYMPAEIDWSNAEIVEPDSSLIEERAQFALTGNPDLVEDAFDTVLADNDIRRVPAKTHTQADLLTGKASTVTLEKARYVRSKDGKDHKDTPFKKGDPVPKEEIAELREEAEQKAFDDAYEQEREFYYQDTDSPRTITIETNFKVGIGYLSTTADLSYGEIHWDGDSYNTDEQLLDAIWESWKDKIIEAEQAKAPVKPKPVAKPKGSLLDLVQKLAVEFKLTDDPKIVSAKAAALRDVIEKAGSKFNQSSSSQYAGAGKWVSQFQNALKAKGALAELTPQQIDKTVEETRKYLAANLPPKPPEPKFHDQFATANFELYQRDAKLLKEKLAEGLDMDWEAREERRKKLGFTTKAYKGVTRKDAFIVLKGGDLGSEYGDRGAFFSNDPDVANVFRGSEGAVYPVWLRTAGWKVIDYKGASYSSFGGNSAQIKKAKDEGYTGLWLKNVDDSGGTADQFIAWTTSDIRSWHARFDETDQFLGDMLAAGVRPVKPALAEQGFTKLRDISRKMKEAAAVVNRMVGPIEIVWHEMIPATMLGPADGVLADTLGGYWLPPGYRGGRTPTGLPADALIGLAYGDPNYDPTTIAGHEAFHHVELALATPEEIAVLTDPRELARVKERFGRPEIGAAIDQLSDIEVRAWAFQRFRRLRDARGGDIDGIHPQIVRLWERMRQFLRRVYNLLRGLGYMTIEDIFEKAASGEFASRRAGSVGGGVQSAAYIMQPRAYEGFLEGAPNDEQRQIFEDIIARLPDSVSLDLVLPDASHEVGGGQVAGSYSAAANVLELILHNNSNPIDTLRHEEVHALRQLGLFTDEEWKVLVDHSHGVRDAYQIDRPYREFYSTRFKHRPELLEETIAEEAVGFMIGDFRAGINHGEKIDPILHKGNEFVKALSQAAHEAGIDTVDDIIARIESGEIGRRKPKVELFDPRQVEIKRFPMRGEVEIHYKGKHFKTYGEKQANGPFEQPKVQPDWYWIERTRHNIARAFTRNQLRGWGHDPDNPPKNLRAQAAGVKSIGPFDPLVSPPPKAPPEQWAGNINLDKIEDAKDVPQLLQELAQHYDGFIEARGGRISHARTREMAQMLGLDPAKLAKKRKNLPGMREAQMFAVRSAMVAGGQRLYDLAQKAQGGSDADKVALLKERARLGAIAEYVAGETAYAGRLLNQFKMVAGGDKELMKALLSDQGQNLDSFIDMVIGLKDPAKVAGFSNKSLATKSFDILMEIWINMLLSGPTTHAANFFGNTLTAVWQVPESFVASVISQFTGSGIPLSEAGYRAMGLVQGMVDGAKAAALAARTEEASNLAGKIEVRHPKAIPGKLGRAIRIPGLALLAADEWFKAINYRAEINSRALRQAVSEGLTGAALARRFADLVANPTDRMLRYGRKAAETQTFTNQAGWIAGSIQKLVGKAPLLRFVVPFIRTPANIVTFAARRTPFGLLFKDVQADLQGVNGAQARDEAIARMTMGSALGLMAVYMAAGGLLTGGGPDDPRERALLYTTGWQPYSIKIGGVYYSYARFEPLAMLLGVATDAYELQKVMSEDDKANVAALIIGAVSRNLTNKTFLRGIAEMIEVWQDPERYGYQWWKNFSGTLVPTGLAQLARTRDPYLREARSVLDNIKSRVPGWRETLNKRRDPFGEEIKKEGAVGPDIVSPVFVSTIKGNPAAEEMLRVGYAPGMPGRSIMNVELTPDQYEAYAIYAGRATKQRIEALIVRDAYQRLPEDRKAEFLRREVDRARSEGRKRTIRDFPDLRAAIQAKRRERAGRQPLE